MSIKNKNDLRRGNLKIFENTIVENNGTLEVYKNGKWEVIATNQATSANEANQLISSTQNLFVNFFDSAIISLNSRIVSENATIVIKLRFVQAELDTL